jgi:hypothetical protein
LNDLKRHRNCFQLALKDLPKNDEHSNALLKSHEEWRMDALAMIRVMMGTQYKQWTFVRRNPLCASLWVHYLRVTFHHQGIHYAAVPGFILNTTQLYCCLRQQPIFDGEWKDLD